MGQTALQLSRALANLPQPPQHSPTTLNYSHTLEGLCNGMTTLKGTSFSRESQGRDPRSLGLAVSTLAPLCPDLTDGHRTCLHVSRGIRSELKPTRRAERPAPVALCVTDPSGTYHAWKANAIGRGAKSVREFLEKNCTVEAVETGDLAIKLVVKALQELVRSGGKNIDLVVMRCDQPLEILNPEENEKYVTEIEKEKEENEKKKQNKAALS
ncbi:PREDICTED: proteasome subunit alpha type-2-like [Elephantulus edwardii]|uniref:proteasome subunit alpha type-2-like n=1 Tax=Elephantulus edwardii TaxID=28737 RepID=UPI0003F09A3E|nr:PREDICTED: proteasome subunit alpha type-2-like [Elephantulus edwardii]